MQSFLQRMFGYCLTGSVIEHALFFLYGPGGNGKSTILETGRAILGDYSRSAPSGMCMSTSFDRHPTDVAGLRGTRMAITTEIDEGRAWDTTRIKGLTGGDAISARFMRQDYFDFDPKFKLLISGNDQPRLSRVDDAIRRRFNVLPFRVRITDPDPEFREKLRPEWPGILACMIQGCLSWQEHGLSAPALVTSATADYLESQDTTGRWIAEECELKPGTETPVGELFQSFTQWCSRNDEQECSIKAFGNDLRVCCILTSWCEAG
jgi:putative DNA primase/helicase